MSRYEFIGKQIPDTQEQYGIALGWDDKLQTYWASIYEGQDVIKEFGLERAEIVFLAHLSEKIQEYGQMPDGVAQRLIVERGE